MKKICYFNCKNLGKKDMRKIWGKKTCEKFAILAVKIWGKGHEKNLLF